VLAEPLDEFDLLLRDDLDRPEQDDQQEDREAEQDDAVERNHARMTSSTMPSAPTTRILTPVAIGSCERAAQSSPPTLTPPDPSVASISCVTMPCLPTSGSVRDGTPWPPRYPTSRDRSPISDTTRTTTKIPICGMMPNPKYAAAAAATAPALTNAKPKWGIDTSTIAPTSASASQASVAISANQLSNRLPTKVSIQKPLK